MDAFVRKLAALSVLWSLCELLVPEGGQRRLVRMTASALVMLTLLTAFLELLPGGAGGEAALPALGLNAPDDGGYAAAALKSLANQAEGVATRIAERAGYMPRAAVYLRRDGSLDHIELALGEREGYAPLISPGELARKLADAFNTEAANIRVTDGAMDE